MRVASLMAVVVAGAVSFAGCAYPTSAKAPARGELWIADEKAGEAAPGGGEVQVPVTYFDPTWHLYLDEEDDVPDASGTLARTRVEPITASALCATSTLTVPCSVALGFLVANPTACVACLAPLGDVFLLSGVNALSTTSDNASWGTVPLMAVCALAGLAPLALLPFALRVPEEVELPLAPGALSAPVPSSSPSAALDERSPEVSY